MPGDYLFPKRRFKSNEPLDADELNEALLPAAERVNGHIGPHNLRAPLNAAIAAENDTFFRTRQVFVDVDPKLSTAQSPATRVKDGFIVEQGTSWQVIEADTEGRDMSIELATGSSTLAMTSFVSYCLHGFDDGERQVLLLDNLFAGRTVSWKDWYKQNDGVVWVNLWLESPTPADYHRFLIQLPGPDLVHTDILKKLAKRIAAAGAATALDQADFSDPSWGTGYTARAEGDHVLFTRTDSAAGGLAISKLQYEAAYTGASVMSVDTSETVASAGSQKLSDLSSSTTAGSASAIVYFPAQIQFALRVDGVVLPETITGRYDNEQGSFPPSQIQDSVSNLTGLSVVRIKERPDALGIPMYTVRLTYNVKVQPGNHVVETVVRRVPMAANRKFRTPVPEVGVRPDPPYAMPADSRITLYNRQLKVVDVTEEATEAAVFDAALEIPAFTNEDVVSHESLDDDRLRPTVDALNDIKPFQVARGAINGAHLAGYSSVLGVAQDVMASGGVLIPAVAHPYSRLQSSTDEALFGQFYTLYKLSGGWTKIVSAPFSTAVPANQPCAISVEGNVFLDKLQTTAVLTSITAAPSTTMHLGAATFCIGLKSAGTWYLWMPSLAWVNSNLYWASEAKLATTLTTIAHLSNYSDNNGHDYFDVPVTAEFVFNYDNLGLLREVTDVAIFGSAIGMKTTITTTVANVMMASVNAVATKS